MSSLSRFKRRTQRSGSNSKEIAINEGIRNFRKTLKENPTSFEIQATIPDEVCVTNATRYIMAIINDATLNDQRALDDKYIHVDIEEDIDVGCYVKWQGINWLLVYQEVNGFPTHKTFVMKRCNQIFRYKQDDIIYDIPVSVTNLTLYSDGLADGKFLSKADAKRNIKFGSSPITRSMDLGTRIMLTNKTVFRFTHIDNFSQEGLLACIGLQTAIIPLDDTENNIAYNPTVVDGDINNNINNDVDDDVDDENLSPVIEGEDYIYLGAEEIYYTNVPNALWITEDDNCKVTSFDDGVCRVSVTDNSKFIGHTFTLYIEKEGSYIAMKDITIKGYF